VRMGYDQWAKGLLGTVLEKSTSLELEHEVPHTVQSVDCVFTPRGRPSPAPPGGWLDRMSTIGPGMIECFSHTLRPGELDACIYKREGLHHANAKRARKRKASRPQRPHLWITSTDRPRDLLHAFEAEPFTNWPRGVWTLRPWFRLHVVVLSELPREPDTLPLRLLGRGTTLRHAMMECAALLPDSPQERLLGDFLLACRHYIVQDLELLKGLSMNALEQVHAMYERLERKLREEGRKEGRKEGREEVRKAKTKALLQVLEWRFGELPEPVAARVARASKKTLDHWFQRALGAATLDDVFAR
jgi:hypothetical protein